MGTSTSFGAFVAIYWKNYFIHSGLPFVFYFLFLKGNNFINIKKRYYKYNDSFLRFHLHEILIPIIVLIWILLKFLTRLLISITRLIIWLKTFFKPLIVLITSSKSVSIKILSILRSLVILNVSRIAIASVKRRGTSPNFLSKLTMIQSVLSLHTRPIVLDF